MDQDVRGEIEMHRVVEGAGGPSRQPRSKVRIADDKRHLHLLFFGFFLLAEHKFA